MGDMSEWLYDQALAAEWGHGRDYPCSGIACELCEEEERNMSEAASGVVGFIKPRKTAKGYTTYAFTFDDRDDDRWFGTYKTNPEDLGIEVGTYVEFEFTKSGAGFLNVENDTVETFEGEESEEEEADEDEEEEEVHPPKSKKKATKKASKKKASGGAARASAAKTAVGHKDANIQWQSARNAALTFISIAQEAGVLDLGTGNKGAKLEALDIMVNQKSIDFFNASMEVASTGEVPDISVG